MSIEAGQPLLQYRLTEKIGEGGMGLVWNATDTVLDRVDERVLVLSSTAEITVDHPDPILIQDRVEGLADRARP
jgi:hypothetical protein